MTDQLSSNFFYFREVTIQKSTGESKSLVHDDAQVAWDSKYKRLYIGRNANYTIKFKELTLVDISEMEVQLQTEHGGKYCLREVILADKDRRRWDSLCRRLESSQPTPNKTPSTAASDYNKKTAKGSVGCGISQRQRRQQQQQPLQQPVRDTRTAREASRRTATAQAMTTTITTGNTHSPPSQRHRTSFGGKPINTRAAKTVAVVTPWDDTSHVNHTANDSQNNSPETSDQEHDPITVLQNKKRRIILDENSSGKCAQTDQDHHQTMNEGCSGSSPARHQADTVPVSSPSDTETDHNRTQTNRRRRAVVWEKYSTATDDETVNSSTSSSYNNNNKNDTRQVIKRKRLKKWRNPNTKKQEKDGYYFMSAADCDSDSDLFGQDTTFAPPATERLVSPSRGASTRINQGHTHENYEPVSDRQKNAGSTQDGKQLHISDFFGMGHRAIPAKTRFATKSNSTHFVKQEQKDRMGNSTHASSSPIDPTSSATAIDTKQSMPTTPLTDVRLSDSTNVSPYGLKKSSINQNQEWFKIRSPISINSTRERLFGPTNDPIEEFDSTEDSSLPRQPLSLTRKPIMCSLQETNRKSFTRSDLKLPTKADTETGNDEALEIAPPVLLPRTSDEPQRPAFRGLRNLGNTCYMNSTLQMVFSLPSTISALRAVQHRGGTLIQSMLTVANEIAMSKTGPATPVNPQAVKKAMDEKTDKFVGFEQRDAHEFVSDLVDHIHEELQANHDSPSDSGTEKLNEQSSSPMDDFLLSVEVWLTCKSCGYKRSKRETYRHLSIDIISDGEAKDASSPLSGDHYQISLEKSLAHFFQPETREVKCEQCSLGTHALQTIEVLQPPRALLLHLKRFMWVEKSVPKVDTLDSNVQDENQPPNQPPVRPRLMDYIFRKNEANVVISETLSLDSFHGLSLQNADRRYHLQSIVHHIGPRASSGHYTADVVRSVSTSDGEGEKNVWVSFDDTSSCITSIEKIKNTPRKQRSAYMLLYVLKEGK